MARTSNLTCTDCEGKGRSPRHLLDAHHAEGGGECPLCRGTGVLPSCIECERPLTEEDRTALGLCARCVRPKVARLAVCGVDVVVSLDEIA